MLVHAVPARWPTTSRSCWPTARGSRCRHRGVGRRRRARRRHSTSRSAATRDSGTSSSRWAATWCGSARRSPSRGRAATPSCSGWASPTLVSTWSSGCSSTTPCRTAARKVIYKNALQGDGARTVWIGDVLIRAAAEGTETFELNRNLVLTDGARADSVPNLEIETGEIAGAGPRQRHRPVRRRAAVLPAEPRHPGGRRAAAGRPRVLRRDPQQDHHSRAAGAAGGGHRGRAAASAPEPPEASRYRSKKRTHVHPGDQGPARLASPPTRAPRRSSSGVDLTVRLRRDPRDHGTERLGQVDARLRDRRPPEVRGHLRLGHARRAGRARP